jgi:hypothetical protein
VRRSRRLLGSSEGFCASALVALDTPVPVNIPAGHTDPVVVLKDACRMRGKPLPKTLLHDLLNRRHRLEPTQRIRPTRVAAIALSSPLPVSVTATLAQPVPFSRHPLRLHVVLRQVPSASVARLLLGPANAFAVSAFPCRPLAIAREVRLVKGRSPLRRRNFP